MPGAEVANMERPDNATILATLAANGGNAKKTAKDLGIPRSTLRYIAGRMSQNARGVVHAAASPVVVNELAENWRRVAHKGTALALEAMEHLDPETLKTSGVKDLLIGAAVATDKAQLLTGGATQRLEQVRIALVDAGALRTLAAQIARVPLAAGDVVEGAYTEAPDAA